ncbi:hypothetical protein E2320_014821 [Naja naja]|nr:hypothetical protein E2320_014821 [Naja naja]
MTYCLSWLLFPWWLYITAANAKRELAFCSNLRMPKEKKSSELEGGGFPGTNGQSIALLEIFTKVMPIHSPAVLMPRRESITVFLGCFCVLAEDALAITLLAAVFDL